MKYQQENKCKICGSFFCCEKCRRRHEEQKHGEELEHIEKMKTLCVICKGEPLNFHPTSIAQEVFAHVVKNHLPLHCKKCNKVYTSERDIAENWKCGTNQAACKLESANPSIVINSSMTSQARQTISTQTSPGFPHLDATKNQLIVTPTVPMFSIQPKLLSGDGSIMDSVSSIRNAFSLSSSVPIPPDAGKLVRTTSTPFERPELKLNPQHFDSSSQVSSIHGSSSESDLIVHSASSSIGSTKPKGKLQITRARSKMPVSATPLRQVLSKSIQRAIAEHGPINVRDKGLQPKKIFGSMNNSSYSLASPMDLRTSPVLRRSHSECVDRTSTYDEFQTATTSSRKQIISSSTRVITEDIIISSSSQVYEKLSTVYESCQTIESLRSLSEQNSQSSATHPIITPTKRAASGGSLKKAITFDTPEYSRRRADEELDDDVFYTPKSISLHRSNTSPNLGSNCSPQSPKCVPVRKAASYKAKSPNSPLNKKAKSPNSPLNKKENQKPISQGGFWSLVSSVVRLASFGGKDKSHENQNEELGGIKRCSSFAGVIGRKKSNDDDYISQKIKRKRTSTFGTHAEISLSTDNEGDPMGAPITKRVKRIQCRKPIERMRTSRCDS